MGKSTQDGDFPTDLFQAGLSWPQMPEETALPIDKQTFLSSLGIKNFFTNDLEIFLRKMYPRIQNQKVYKYLEVNNPNSVFFGEISDFLFTVCLVALSHRKSLH